MRRRRASSSLIRSSSARKARGGCRDALGDGSPTREFYVETPRRRPARGGHDGRSRSTWARAWRSASRTWRACRAPPAAPAPSVDTGKPNGQPRTAVDVRRESGSASAPARPSMRARRHRLVPSSRTAAADVILGRGASPRDRPTRTVLRPWLPVRGGAGVPPDIAGRPDVFRRDSAASPVEGGATGEVPQGRPWIGEEEISRCATVSTALDHEGPKTRAFAPAFWAIGAAHGEFTPERHPRDLSGPPCARDRAGDEVLVADDVRGLGERREMTGARGVRRCPSPRLKISGRRRALITPRRAIMPSICGAR
jgi:hypothetical protein